MDMRALQAVLTTVLLATAAVVVTAGPPARQLKVSTTDSPVFLPYEVTVREYASTSPASRVVGRALSVLKPSLFPGDSAIVIYAHNPVPSLDNPASFTVDNFTRRLVIDDNPIRMVLNDYRIFFGSSLTDARVFTTGFRNDSAFAATLSPFGDTVSWLYLTTGEDHSGDGNWEPELAVVAITDFDYDGRREGFVLVNAGRDLTPRELFCIDIEALAIEWSLPVATGVGWGGLYPCGDSADPGVIFASYNPKQGVSDSLFSDSWAYVTVVDRAGQVRLHRVIANDHGHIHILPTSSPDEFLVAHEVPFVAPQDTVDFPPNDFRVSVLRINGEVVASTPSLPNPIRSMWRPLAAEGKGGLWGITTDGRVWRFNDRLEVLANSEPSGLQCHAATIALPGMSDSVWVFNSEIGTVVVSSELKQLALLSPTGAGITDLLEYDADRQAASFVSGGGISTYVVTLRHRGLASYLNAFLNEYRVHLLGAVIGLLVLLVALNYRRAKVLQRLRGREVDFLAFCNATPDLAFRIDRNLVLRDYWAGDRSQLAVGPDQFMNRPMSAWASPELIRQAADCVERTLATQTLQTINYTLEVHGESRHYEMRMAPVGRDEILAVARNITDQVRAEQDLRNSEQRFRLLFEGARDAVVIAETETGIIVDVNRRGEELFGCPRSELIGKHQTQLHPAESREKYASMFREYVDQGGKQIPQVADIWRADGQRWPVEISAALVEIQGQSYIQGLFRDISERLEAEDALRQSEERFRTLVANVPAAIYRALPKPGQPMDFVSDEIESITGFAAAVFLPGGGKPYRDLVHPDDLPALDAAIGPAITSQQSFSIEYRLRDRRGEIHWVHERGQCVVGPDGEVSFIDGAVYDITERKLADQALRESEEKARAQFKGMPVPTYTWQRTEDDFVLVDYNDAAVVATEGKIASIVGSRCSDLYGERSQMQDDMQTCCESRTTVIREMHYAFQTVQKTAWMLVHYVFVPPNLVLVHTEDITERHVSQERLKTRLRYEEGLAACSQTLLQAPASDAALTQTLVRLLEASDACRAYLYENFENPDLGLCARQTHEVCREGVLSLLHDPKLQRVPYSPNFERMRDRLAAGNPAGGVVNQMVGAARDMNEPLGIRSVLTLPVFVGGRWYGFVGFDDTRSARLWNEEDIRLLRTAAAMIGSYLDMAQANRDLRAERDFSRLLLQTANSLIVCLDDQARIVVFNDELERLTGYAREEVLGKVWYELFLPERQRHEGLNNFAKWIMAHPSDRYEGILVTRAGEERTVLWSNSILKDPHTGMTTAVAIGHDITERKEAQQRFERLFRSSPALMALQTLPDQRFADVNDAFVRTLGYSKSELVGKTPAELELVLDRAGQLAAGERLAKEGQISGYEFQIRRKDGALLDGLFSGELISIVGRQFVLTVMIDITERKAAEAAVAASEEKYRAVMEQTADNIYLAEFDTGRIIEPNPALCELLGYTSDEMRDMTVFDFIDHERDDVREKMDLVAAGSLSFLRERYYRTRDGRRIPVEVGINVVEYAGRKVLCIVSRDISERKAAEEALRQQEERYRLLVENVRASIALVGYDGTFLFANGNAARAAGCSPPELVGKSQWDVFPKELADRQMANVRQVIENDREFVSEAPVFLAGEWRWFYNNLQPYRDVSGRTTAALVIAYDVTSARQAQQALLLSEERFHDTADLLPQTIFETDAEGRLTYVNRHGFEATGYTPEDLGAGVFVDQFFPENERDAIWRELREALKGAPSIRDEYIQMRKDGSTYPSLIYTSPIVRDGVAVGLRGVGIDITERKKAEEEVRRANQARYRQLREIAGGVSHEIYNSLYPAVVSLDKLRSLLAGADVRDVARTERLLAMTDTAVKRAITLTEMVNQYSKLDMQRQVEEVSLAAMVHDAVDQNSDRIEATAVVTSVSVPAGLTVMMSKVHVHSLINNLLINAIDAVAEMPDRRISISAVPCGAQVRIEVSDTGPGIPFEVQQRVFEPFFTTKPAHGTGLGLAIVKRIVELYGGEVTIETALDRGTTFGILLPSGNQG